MNQTQHKPDVRKANICPELPNNSSTFDTIIYWLGIGLGSGRPKKAAGTWGTLGGILLAIPLMMLGFVPFFIITLFSSIIGIWICGKTSQLMDVHDDPHIVFDEWAGIWITLLPISLTTTNNLTTTNFGNFGNNVTSDWALITSWQYWLLMVVAFIIFRFFDIIKPFPISYLDKKLSGGFGIMVDDLLAGVFSAGIIAFLITIL